jgi:hypothetical protein
MPKFPPWGVGVSVSGTNLALDIPDIYVKTANETATADIVLSNDAELTAIPLAVGTHWVKLMLLFYTDTTATPDIKTRWAFTGTWNNPIRACIGPPSSNVAAAGAITPMLMAGIAAGTDATYGSAAGTANAYVVLEESYTVVVTVAGTLSLQWAQRVSDASLTTVVAGTTMATRQIAT